MRNQNNVLFQVVNGLITLFWTVLFTLFTVMAHASPEFTVLPCISGVALYSGGDGDTGLWLYDNPSWVREGDVYAEGFLSFRDNPNVLGNVIVGGSATNQSEFWEGTVRGTVTIGLAQHTPHFVNRPSLCADVPAGKDCLVTAGTYTGIPIGSPNTNGRAIVTNSGIPYTACDVPRYSGDTDSGVTPFSSWSPPASETLFQWKNSTQMDLNPGFYGRVRIRQSNNLTINLYSGTYYLDDLFLEECTGIHFKVNVNAAGEPVYLLLKNGIKFTSNSMWGIPNLPSFPIPSSSLITWNQNGDASNIIIYAENGDFISPSHPYESSYTILNAIVVAANGNIRLIDGNGNGINGSFLASKELVYYQYSLGELRSLSAGGKCPAPIDEIGGIAFSQENDVTPRNFIVGEVNDHWLLVQSTYDNTKGNWGGSLQAHPLALGSNSNTNSNTNAGPTTPAPTAWSDTAEARLANRVGRGAAGGAQNARLIKTSLPNGTSVAWSSSQLSTVQKQQILDKKPLFSSFSGTDDEFVEQLIRYHLGEASAESSSDFKNRDNIFGDSVFCEPKLLGPSLVRLKTYQNGSETPHVAFREQTQNRTPYVVTCGNDGVLRFTDLATGEETFAYILQNAIGKLPITAHRDEVHEYTLDGAITIGDAFIHQAWTTVGVVTCGVGGNCLAAVDLGYDTVLDDSHSPRVLWELNQDDIAGADLNLTLADA
ncbi:MAG: PilC/PilY family type IV pilus protein, partial [Gammaproteobacteria bacterium]